MRLHSIKLHNIRNFFGTVDFDFSQSRAINTISGVNGSGKSTIFKSLSLCQKGYFLNEIEKKGIIYENESLLLDSFPYELAKFFTQKGSFIEVSFNHAEVNKASELSKFRLVCNKHNDGIAGWEIEIDENSQKLISLNWKLQDPKNIILYIDSDKHFFEESILHTNISIPSQNHYNQLVIDLITNPEDSFANIYQNLVKDYLRERLVPGKPRKDIYFNVTKMLLKTLLPKLELSNFSGLHFPNQFVLLGKNNSSSKQKKANFYDTRNLSSGEKVLFYSLLFINYIPEIGLLIIDEPENHFHEDLLVKFVKMLDDICNSTNYVDYLSKVPNSKLKSQKAQLDKVYGNHTLSQVYLLTHSKNLIYNNFTNGSNYYVESGIQKLEFDSFESVLRTIGLSSIYSKVLFVEGSKEEGIFSSFFNEHNIKVHVLNGCSQVIDTYRRLLQIKSYLYNYHFCFVIDNDTSNDVKTVKIRSEDTSFFDKNFVILPKHEIENYMLDEELFYLVIEKHREMDSSIPSISKLQILAEIKDDADNDKNRVIQKALMELNEASINKLNSKLVKKTIPTDSLSSYQTDISASITNANIDTHLYNDFTKNYQTVQAEYNTQSWNTDWKSLCDGKSVYQAVLMRYAKYLGLTRERLERDIIATLKEHDGLAIRVLIDSLIKKF
ncbi:AAA family ATPase [Microvirga sp. STS02]|uniref:AAA family ATPase n=1 Tax=Hymenobacter negativus TaxID=2795026 RepID=UPI0018DDB1F8|nr:MULTISPECIES: AAA family ATPase [Bacteria]MBH8567887.1 AAA family ATPase [Hymenobacter negativus]MBR7207623.1 AAA family ATPase [Microvirga sp. STS02]